MLSYRDANLLLGLLWHSPNAQRERKVPNTTACRVHFSCDCICILTTTTYYHHLSSTFVRVQNHVKHSDSRLNSVATMLRNLLLASLRFHRVGQAPYFYRCDEQLILVDFSRENHIYIESSQMISTFRVRVPNTSARTTPNFLRPKTTSTSALRCKSPSFCATPRHLTPGVGREVLLEVNGDFAHEKI